MLSIIPCFSAVCDCRSTRFVLIVRLVVASFVAVSLVLVASFEDVIYY